MSHSTAQPRLTLEGVMFTVKVGSQDRTCLITREALDKLSALKSIDATDADTMEVFHAFENTISGVACELVTTKAQASPVLMSADAFH